MHVCACVRLGEGPPGLPGWAVITVTPLPPQQTSEPSYPDIILIAINRHGVLLIHPKTKVVAGPRGLRQGPWTPAQLGLPSWAPTHGPMGSGGPRAAAQTQGPWAVWALIGFHPPPTVPPGPAHHLPLHQDCQLEQRQYTYFHMVLGSLGRGSRLLCETSLVSPRPGGLLPAQTRGTQRLLTLGFPDPDPTPWPPGELLPGRTWPPCLGWAGQAGPAEEGGAAQEGLGVSPRGATRPGRGACGPREGRGLGAQPQEPCFSLHALPGVSLRQRLGPASSGPSPA